MEGDDDALVAQGDERRVADVVPGGLLGRRLDLVLFGEFGSYVVQGDVDGGRDPPEDDLDDEGSDNVNDKGVVGPDEVSPGGLEVRRSHVRS